MHQQRIHQRTQNSIVQNVDCLYCGREFGNSLALKIHIGKSHQNLDGVEKSETKGGLSREQKNILTRELRGGEAGSSEQLVSLSQRLGVTVKHIQGWIRKRGKEGDRQAENRAQTEVNERSFVLGKRTRHPSVEVYYDDHEEGEEVYPAKVPYNPGHKKTKFSEFQRNHLRQFFQVNIFLTLPLLYSRPQTKEYVEEDDISELSAELMLSPKVEYTS